MSDEAKTVVKVLLWFANVALVWVTFDAFLVAGSPLLGIVVILVLTFGIGYFVASELQ